MPLHPRDDRLRQIPDRDENIRERLCVRAVLVGRLPVWGLAAGGTAGVERVLENLRSEMVRTMRLMGCRSVADLDPSWLDADTVPAHAKKEVEVL